MRHIVLHEKISAKGMENMSDKNKRRIGNIGSIGIGGILCAAFAVIALALCVILMAYTESEPAGIVLTVLVVYVVVAAVTIAACIVSGGRASAKPADMKGSVFGAITLDFIQNLHMPTLVCDDKGKIVWYNSALSANFKSHSVLYGKYLDNICDATLERIMKSSEAGGVEVSFVSVSDADESERPVFRVKGYEVSSKGKKYYMTIFEDISELKNVYKRLDDEDTVVAYAMIDNIDEIMQYGQGVDNNAVFDVFSLLKRDMDAVGGVIKEYNRNQFAMFFDAKYLEKFEKERFSVLDDVREVSIGDSTLPVTVSIGIGKTKGTLAEKARFTQAALDLALQRGGDQVVVKTPDGVEFYGGKTKTVQKRTKVRARVIANELLMLMSGSDNVIVMGHKYADFDAFGSCLAIVQLAKFCGVKAYVVTDRTDKNLAGCFKLLEKNPEYNDIFVDRVEAQDLITSTSLAVMVDVNNVNFCEAPDVIANAKNVVIIDHHRKTAEFAIQPNIVYIEPSASSAAELVSELLEQVLPQGALSKEIADLLFAGMLLDTKQFTHNTGVRTFGSALYLRGEGASPLDANALFKTSIQDFLTEARFESNVVIHRSVIAIAFNNEQSLSGMSRVNAAKAADRLLHVDGVLAAFAICKIGDTVHISARSESSINVQLILEKMGGGGHFDAAGAQVSNVSIQDALATLRACIDEYMDENM